MVQLPFDPADPPDTPPTEAVLPMLWRVAIRLYRDHAAPGPAHGGVPLCPSCGADWPCRARRLAVRGLLAACSSEA